MAMCRAIKEDGKGCGAHAGSSGYCYQHDPDISNETKKEARVRGGRNSAMKIDEPLPARRIRSSEDIVKLLEETINLVRGGKLQIKIANCIGFLSGHILRAVETGELEKRLQELERKVF